jgi:hypothetical protein
MQEIFHVQTRGGRGNREWEDGTGVKGHVGGKECGRDFEADRVGLEGTMLGLAGLKAETMATDYKFYSQ